MARMQSCLCRHTEDEVYKHTNVSFFRRSNESITKTVDTSLPNTRNAATAEIARRPP